MSVLSRRAALTALILSTAALHCQLPGEEVDANSAAYSAEEAHAVACADALAAIPTTAFHPEGRVDPNAEEPISHATRVCLSRYVQINTSNPHLADEPGEIAAVVFFEKVFERLGIATQRAPLVRNDDPKRASVVASMRGSTRERSVVLLNHTDVVRAEGQWKYPPFSGRDDGQFIWGRGSLDMKGVGIIQLVSMAILARSGAPLGRDVHFAAVADEEIGGTGAEYLAVGEILDETHDRPHDPLGLHPGVVLNEGGTGIRDALVGGRDVLVLGVEEKGLVWTQMAHRDPRAVLGALAKAAILKPPSSNGMPSSSVRAELRSRCALAEMMSDEEQKTNMQPRHAKLTLACSAGSVSVVKSAVEPVLLAFTPAPVVQISEVATDDGERVTIAIEMGAGGHGSAAVVNALDVAASTLVAAGQVDERALRPASDAVDRFFKKSLSPANSVFLGRVGRAWGEVASTIPELLGSDLFFGLADSFLPTEAPFRNTCSWTTFRFPVDGEARAKVDCRIGWDADATTFESNLYRFIADTGVEKRSEREHCFDCYHQPFNASPFDASAKDYAIIRHVLQRSSPNVIVSPYLFPASSDSYYFRRAGVPTYGVLPTPLGEAEINTFHGLDERMPVESLFGAVRAYAETVHKLSNDIAPAARDGAHRLASPAIKCQRREAASIFGGGFVWKEEALDRPICEGTTDTVWRCETSADAPRFLRTQPLDNDARVYEVQRLKSDYSGASVEAERIPAAAIERTVYRSRSDGDNPSVRVFEGEEFDLDTGTAPRRQFALRCTTPTHQFVATGFTRAKLDFFRD